MADASLAFLRRAAKVLARAGVSAASWQHPDFGVVSITVEPAAAVKPKAARTRAETPKEREARLISQWESEVYGRPPPPQLGDL